MLDLQRRSEIHSFVHSFHKYLLSVYNVLKTFLDSWATILNSAQKKKKTSCPLGASSLGRKTVNTEETHLECGRAREENRAPEEKAGSVKSEQTSETRKKSSGGGGVGLQPSLEGRRICGGGACSIAWVCYYLPYLSYCCDKMSQRKALGRKGIFRFPACGSSLPRWESVAAAV